MPKFFNYTATGRYYKVYKDNEYISQHSKEREAIETANETKFNFPNSDVCYTHDYEVEVGLTDAGLTVAKSYAPAVDQPPTITSTPSVIFVEGTADSYDFSTHVSDDGVSALSYSLTNVIPNGMTLNASTGVLTYDGVEPASVSQHQLVATDAVGSDTSTLFDIEINAVFAQYYYIATDGDDGVGDGSYSNPYKTIAYAMTTHGGGETYVFKDGTYDYTDSNIVNPPSGSAGNPTTIIAENDGLAIIDGGGTRTPIDLNTTGLAYITIEGFKCIGSDATRSGNGTGALNVESSDNTVVANYTNNIVLRRIGAEGGKENTESVAFRLVYVRDSLVEECWAYGHGRYTMAAGGCSGVTFRRCVARWDGWENASKPGEPRFNFAAYNVHDSTFENCIFLDATSTATSSDKGCFYLPSNSVSGAPLSSTENCGIYGCIVLNHTDNGNGFNSETSTGDDNYNLTFENCVGWDVKTSGVVARNTDLVTYDHCTFSDGFRGTYFGGSGNGVTNVTFKNSLVHDNSYRGIDGDCTSDYNNAHNNVDNWAGGASQGANSISSNPTTDYIVRVETDDPGYQQADDGGDMGANIIKRYEDGVLSDTNLWPFPNQARIKADMADWDNRGFTLSTSLTHYIWEYLGNTIPSEYE